MPVKTGLPEGMFLSVPASLPTPVALALPACAATRLAAAGCLLLLLLLLFATGAEAAPETGPPRASGVSVTCAGFVEVEIEVAPHGSVIVIVAGEPLGPQFEHKVVVVVIGGAAGMV